MEDRPSGADCECRQGAKTINAAAQQRLRAEKRRREQARKFNEATVEMNVINNILQRNTAVEDELRSQVDSELLVDNTISHFASLVADKLKDFIHARKFKGKSFQLVKLAPAGKKLNKTVYRGQTPDEIERDCNEENPCLVWLAWSIRNVPIILRAPDPPILQTSLEMPQFQVTYAGRLSDKDPSEYLRNEVWIDTMKSTVKGVRFEMVDDKMIDRASALKLKLQQRLDLHISDTTRVDRRRREHYTLDFVRDNIPAMAAALCLCGHVAEDLSSFGMDECLLVHPNNSSNDNVFKSFVDHPMGAQLDNLEGCYLHYDRVKMKWIRSGKASGAGVDACFKGRQKTHERNARSVKQMREHRFYQEYPARGVPNIGGTGGYFENLERYCGMAFDKDGGIKQICMESGEGSLFVWRKECVDVLKQRDGSLQESQLLAISYLWELCYDLLLAKHDNVSASPGFEALGLRIN